MLNTEDTIVAIASPTTPAAVGVVRLSGVDTLAVLNRLGIQITTRRAHFREVKISVDESIRDLPVRVMIWPTTRSYTGQPSAEIHTYGSLPILQSVVQTAVTAGARPANPGEFTMRAFLAGRLDLTQAEAVLGVIDAETRGSLDHALRQLAGNLSRPLEALRSDMLDLLADVEAGLDFVDEDIEFVSDDAIISRLSLIAGQLLQTQQTIEQRGDTADAMIIAIRGEPNAGKSQLINRISNSQAAIVADQAGTTRDVVTVNTQIANQPVCFVDTAGIETVHHDDMLGKVSAESQRHAARASLDAETRIWCVDSSRPDFAQAAQHLREHIDASRQSATDIWVATKMDLAPGFVIPTGWIGISSQTAEGITPLIDRLTNVIANRDRSETGSVIGTATRCRESLRQAIDAIDQAIGLTKSGDGHEFVASEIRLAVQSLGEVTGAVYTDDILDRVFGRFCIGK